MTEEELNVLMREPQNEGEYLGATLRLLIEHREDKYNEYVKKYARRFGDYECLELVEREEEVHKLLHKNPDELTGQEIKWLKGLHEDSGIDVEDFLTQKELRQFYQIIGLGPQIEEPEQPHIQEPASNKQQLVVKQQTPVEPKKESVIESKYIPSVNMQTTPKIINALQSLLNTMFKRAKEGNTDCVLTEDMLGEFRNMAVENPALYPFCLNDLPSSQEVASFFGNVEKHASTFFTMPYMPISYFKDNIQGKDVYTPAFLPWQTKDNKVKNFIINYDNSTAERAAEIYKHMVMSILLGLPAKSVHLSFVNTQFSDWINFFTSADALDKTLYDKITSNSEYHQLLERLRKRIQEYKFGPSLEVVNESSGKIEDTYEIVILIDDPEAEMQYQDELVRYFENGSKFGIYFIGLNNTEKVAKRDDQDNILKHTDSYYSINAGEVNSWKQPQKNGFITTASIANNSFWSRAAFDYLKEIVNRKVVHKFDWDTALKTPYNPTDNELIAPIGFTEDGVPFNFNLDVDKEHYHAFVIGATGSGKSRFLHDVILSMTAKYQPEDVELYLLDFKGVEFNCYRDLKHARAILVNNADEQITYEVINDIKRQIDKRTKLLREAGVSKVSAYNQLNTGTHLSQIVLLVDECQTLFTSRVKNATLQKEIIKIIVEIAQKGRSNGIHLVLSTQSLENTPLLGEDILRQIGEHYILPCIPADAGQLVPKEKKSQIEEIVATMNDNKATKKGQCYYQGVDGEVLFTFNFVAEGEMQQSILGQIKEKSQSHRAVEQKYFDGALQFGISEDIKDIITSVGKNSIVASPGRTIDLEQNPLTISLRDDYGENIALFGNEGEYFSVPRTTVDLLTSLIISNKFKGLGYSFVVLNCANDADAAYVEVLNEMADANLCELVSPRDRASKLRQLCEDISADCVNPTILVIIGQDKISGKEFNKPFVTESNTQSEVNDDESQMPDSWGDIMSDYDKFIEPSLPKSNTAKVNSIKEAINYIMDEGSIKGVHTIIQVDRPSKFLYVGEYFNPEDFHDKCKHTILLPSTAEYMSPLLRMQEDIQPSELEDDPDRLRAYYYNAGNNKYQLFTPYVLPDKETINNIIK